MQGSLIIGICLLLSSAILSIDKISNLLQYGNSIELTSGKIRLGKVYNERVESSYKVIFEGEKRASVYVTAYTLDIYDAAYKDFMQTLEDVNQTREKDGEELLSKEEASWVNNATIHFTTTVTYSSEFQSEFELTIDETTITHNGTNGKTIMQYLADLQVYSDQMMMEYENNNSFL